MPLNVDEERLPTVWRENGKSNCALPEAASET